MIVAKKSKLSSSEVVEYLIYHPEFFKENPEVLNSIELVHESGAAVSLIQKQVELLRNKYDLTTDKLVQLLDTAKDNEEIFTLTKKLILLLIDSSNIEEITFLLEKSFSSDFGAKTSRILFFTESSKYLPKGRIKSPLEATKILGKLLKFQGVYSGELDENIAKFIFGDKSNIKECALVSLTCNSLPGLIALGTDEIGKYNHNKDTLFLDFIAEVVSKRIDSHNT